jgi:hypothetical protein
LNTLKQKDYYTQKHIMGWTNGTCSFHAHLVKLMWDRYIFQIPVFEGMMCFEIAHHPQASGL